MAQLVPVLEGLGDTAAGQGGLKCLLRVARKFVGEDEADPRNGSISYVSPVARALIGRAAGEIVLAGDHEIEILSID